MILPDPRPDATPALTDLTPAEQHARLREAAMQTYGREMPIANGLECPFCTAVHALILEDTDASHHDRLEFLVYCPDALENAWVRWAG